MSSNFVNPISANNSLTSSAKNVKKLIRYWERPVKRFLSLSSWVATPTGQVFMWHLRIITQPKTIRALVANPNSSAPSKAWIIISWPVLSCPSTCNFTCPLRLFITKVCCVSDNPNSEGNPANALPEIAAHGNYVTTADNNQIGLCFGYSGSNSSYPTLWYQFHTDTSLWIDIF